jgi:hypothetical protein
MLRKEREKTVYSTPSPSSGLLVSTHCMDRLETALGVHREVSLSRSDANKCRYCSGIQLGLPRHRRLQMEIRKMSKTEVGRIVVIFT